MNVLLLAAFVIQIAVNLARLKRKPSIDVDVTKLRMEIATALGLAQDLKKELDEAPSHEGELATINQKLADISSWQQATVARLAEGDRTMTTLRENQAANSAKLEASRMDAHETKTLVIKMMGNMGAIMNKLKIPSASA